MKNYEIERKFFLYPIDIEKFLRKECLSYDMTKIEQYYLATDGSEEIRYRKKGKKYFKTIKKGEGLVREEEERKVKKKEYKKFIEAREGNIIKKRRYSICIDGYIYQFDQFFDYLDGLLTLEVEFEDSDEANEFNIDKRVSKLILKELTGYKEFSNHSLSMAEGIPSLECSSENEQRPDKSISPLSCIKELYQDKINDISKELKLYQEAIINRDSDTENMHQFRVSLRKIKMISKSLRYIFKDNWADKLIGDVGYILKTTNESRDIDVFLDRLDEFRDILPDEQKEAIDKIEHYLLEEKSSKESNIVEFIQSQKVKEILKEIELFGKRSEPYDNKAFEPNIMVAQKSFNAEKNKIIKKAKKLKIDSSEQKFHKLRIEFKKLRYLNELFEPVENKKIAKKRERIIKKIQEKLGTHQDYCVQKNYLQSFKENKELNDNRLQKALENLEKYIDKRILKQRVIFFENFKKFLKSK